MRTLFGPQTERDLVASIREAQERQAAIRFRQHYVTDGLHKCRVHYSVDNHVSRKPCVILYAKDILEELGPIFGSAVRNDTDSMTDYFEKDRITFFEGDPHYEAARAAAIQAKKAQDARRDARIAKRFGA